MDPFPFGHRREQETVLADELRRQLGEASARYKAAKIALSEAQQLFRELGIGHPDGNHALRLALREEAQALTLYTQRLRDFTASLLKIGS